jgi:hypothetical protein
MEDNISFIYMDNCDTTHNVSIQYDIKLLNRGKKIIVNILSSKNGFTDNKLEKILFDDKIELIETQIDLLKIFYKSFPKISLCCYNYCNNITDPIDNFCKIVKKLKHDKNTIFTIDELNSIDDVYTQNKYEKEIKLLKEDINKYQEIINDESEKKTRLLQDKIDRINNSILEKTIENNKLKIQLEDITDLYELLLIKIDELTN